MSANTGNSQRIWFWWTIWAVIFLLLVVSIAGFAIWLSKRTLQQTIAKLEQSGESFDAKSFAPPPAKQEGNGASQLRAFSQQLATHPTERIALLKQFRTYDRLNGYVQKPGYLIVVFKMEKLPGGMEWSDAQKLLNTPFGPILEGIRESVKMPRMEIDRDYSGGAQVPGKDLPAYLSATQFLFQSTMINLQNHNAKGAVSDIETILKIATFCDQHTIPFSQLVESAAVINAQLATWQALLSPDITPPLLEQLQQAWSSVEPIRKLASTLRTERALTRPLFSTDNPEPLVRLYSSGYSSGRMTPFTINDIVYKMRSVAGEANKIYSIMAWKTFYRYGDELAYIEEFQRLIDKCPVGLPDSWFELLKENEARLAKLGTFDRNRYLTILLSTSGPGYLEYFVHAETAKRMTIIAIAIKRFELENGRLPRELTELTPQYLSTIPNDPINGKPFQYHLKDNGFLFYGVGMNGADDGGDPNAAPSTYYDEWMTAMDVVWPQPDDSPTPVKSP